jgi:hypothetical protein
VQVLLGTGRGVDNGAFIASYIAPGANILGIDDLRHEVTVNQPPHGFAGSSPASPTNEIKHLAR